MSQHEYIMTLSQIDAKSMNQSLMDLSAGTTSPIEVSTDAGMNLSGIITKLWTACGVEHLVLVQYHHQVNGL